MLMVQLMIYHAYVNCMLIVQCIVYPVYVKYMLMVQLIVYHAHIKFMLMVQLMVYLVYLKYGTAYGLPRPFEVQSRKKVYTHIVLDLFPQIH